MATRLLWGIGSWVGEDWGKGCNTNIYDGWTDIENNNTTNK